MKFSIFILCSCLFLISCDTDDENICAPVTHVFIDEIEATFATVEYDLRDNINYQIEYGVSEFSIGTGTKLIVDANFATLLLDLVPSTDYDVYVRALCSGNNLSDYANVVSFTTANLSCNPPINVTATVIDYNEALVSWEASSNNEISYEIEYGFTDFELGMGIMKPASETELLLDALVVGTSYDYYIRSYCDGEVSIFEGPFIFTTRACVLPSSFMISEITSTTALASWEGNGEVSWELEYGVAGFELGDGEVIFLGETEVELPDLNTGTSYDAFLRANCGPNGRSAYIGPVTFITL